jgi:RNA polymerase sigma-70 factor (ECF subfamily)
MAQTAYVQTIITPSPDISDTDIIQNIKAGDIDAYGSIIRRYNQRMFRIARSIVTDDDAAKDIVQEAHIKAYNKLDDFQGTTNFFSWLASITRNESLMYLRKYKREVSMEENTLQFLEDNVVDLNTNNKIDSPDTSLENKQLQDLIHRHLDELPEIFRTVFVLRSIEQLSVKETAEILDIKEETVKTRYFRAKRLLRTQIQSYLDDVRMKIYEFAGHHCDYIVHNVMSHIHNINK